MSAFNRVLAGWALRLPAVLTLLLAVPATAADLRLLFMGDRGHHQPARRFQELAPVLESRGIVLQYTERMEDLNAKTLDGYDGLILYANIDTIAKAQADAVLAYVAQGHGFIPLHCATYCWRNDPRMVALMGGQFQRHGGQVFSVEVAEPKHPIMQGYESFTSWDETYIHHLHNEENRTVLEYRIEGEQAEGNQQEPWTWIRTHGQGHVFYTAWGHDQRTFTNPGYHSLVERGIRWACGDDPAKAPAYRNLDRFVAPEMTPPRSDDAEFEYVDVGPKIPNYTPGERWGTQGAPKNLMQKPLSVEASMKRFVTPQGMAVRRYADERDFQSKPIAMTWDERGRLWVCETVDYPNELGKGRDRIRICEDTDGDHIADKFTVFATGLSIPTAIVIYRGGAIVQNGTETLYLKDTDGDDVADLRKTLIGKWQLGDTHGGVSNFRYGLDNWIWAMQGYNNSRPEFAGERSQSFRQGFWRFKLSSSDPPRVTDLEFIRSSDNNTWGLGISEEGLIFGSTANHNPSMFMPIPNRYYERVRGWAPSTLHSIADTHQFDPITDKVRQVDHHGGYTAGAGHALYTARTFPEQWWNRTAFVCGPTGHLVGTFVLRREGANYKSTSPVNLLASDDEWSAPVMAEVGPDGAVWVIDWYNYIVQHNPTPQGFKTGRGAAYESDLRDKKHGRIYRVVPVGEAGDKLHAFESLAEKTNTELVETLKHPSFRWRLHAQRLLIEREADEVADQLAKLVRDQKVDALGLNVGAIHALQTLSGLGLIDVQVDGVGAEALPAGLRHESAGVRRNALAVLPPSAVGLQRLLEHRDLFRDADVQVRLQAILTLADMPTTEQTGALVAELAAEETDGVLLDALTSAAAAHSVPFLKAISKADAIAADRGLQPIARRIAVHVARGRPDAASLTAIVAGLEDAPASLVGAIIDGLNDGLPAGYQTESTAALDRAMAATFASIQPAAKVKLLQLAKRCGTEALDAYAEEMIEGLIDTIADVDADASPRIAAARELVGFRPEDEDAAFEIIDQIQPQTSPRLAAEFLEAIAESEAEGTGALILEALPTMTPQVKSNAIGVLLSKSAWTKALLAAAEDRAFDLNELSLEQKQSLQSHPDEPLRAQAEELLAMDGGLPDADREKVLQSLMHLTEATGDATRGVEVFKKSCAACHQHGDMGNQVGPDLTGMAVHPKAELLTHIIDPSRSVEGNYRLYNVLTLGGEVISGMLAGESRTSITIIDSQAKKIDVPREDIEQLIASRKSVMPEGFEQQLSEQQLSDLLEFLTSKGKYVPIPLDRYATAVSTKPLFGETPGGPDQLIFGDWTPKMVGEVPFVLTDPRGTTTPNLILLNGPRGSMPPKMPRSVRMPCHSKAQAIHLLSGVGGWSYPYERQQSVSMIVRFHYADGETEDHELRNGVHFADYIRRVDVPKSDFAFRVRDQQIRYLAVEPERDEVIDEIELVKGPDPTAPIVMAITIER